MLVNRLLKTTNFFILIMPIAKLVVIYQDMYQKPKWYSIRLRPLDSNACAEWYVLCLESRAPGSGLSLTYP